MSFSPARAFNAPPGAEFKYLEAADGTRFRVARWPAATSAVRGAIVLLQGRREFIEKYYETIADLLDRGYAVYALDWRGQGLSDRPLPNRQKGHVENFDLYLEDMALFMNDFVRPAAPGPLYLLGHSMGGHCAIRYLHDHPGVFEKAVLSAPMIDIQLGGLASVTKLIVQTMINLGRKNRYALSQTDYGESNRTREALLLSSDPVRLQVEIRHCEMNPDLALGGVTYGWLYQAFHSIALLRQPGYAEAIETPLLIETGAADRVVSNPAQSVFAKRLPHGQQHVIENARHELLMERDIYRDNFWRMFDRFLSNV